MIIYDAGLEQEKIVPEIISETLSLEVQNAPNIQSRSIHTVEQGENLSLIFEKYKVSLNNTYKIFREDKSGEIKNIRPGDRLEFISSGDDLTEILINKGPLLSYKINFVPEILIIKIEKKPEFIKTFKTGLIESSFYLAGLKNDIPESVIMDLAYIFGWDIDFVFDIRAGDRFKILYETPYVDGQQIENGSILIAEFYNKNNRYSAIRYKGRSKKWEYFNEDGRSLEKAFLRAPLDFAYISSHFNPNRMHPILHRIKAHNGVDYAAQRNTPVKASGDGTISFVGRKSGYGRTVEIKHGGNIKTLYAHLEKFKPKLKVGDKVKQGEVIAFVGDSGQATGTHLHFEFWQGLTRTDPVKVKLPSAKAINSNQLDEFRNLLTFSLKSLDEYNLLVNE